MLEMAGNIGSKCGLLGLKYCADHQGKHNSIPVHHVKRTIRAKVSKE